MLHVFVGLVGAAALWWLIWSKRTDESPLIAAIPHVDDLSPYMKYAGRRCRNGATALMFAAIKGDIAQVLQLVPVEGGLETVGGETALMHAASLADIAAVRILIAAGEACVESRDGVTALMLVTRIGHSGVAKMLIAAGENPYAVDPETHWTAAAAFGLKTTSPATLQMLCLPHIRYRGRRVGLWHPDLPP